MRPLFFRSHAGFTLVEMSVVLILIALIAGFTLSAGKTQLDVASMQSSKNTLANIKQALLLFRDKRGRFPCPAVATDAPSSGTYGQEQTGCDVTCPAGIVCVNNTAIGMVPFKTLGIDATAIRDGWDNRVTYAVDIQQTGGSTYASGTIQVVDSNNNKVTASQAFGDAIFVLVSHGKDRKGGYTENGTLYTACDATARDGENCNGDDIFRSYRYTESATAANHYDDLIAWYSQDRVPEPVAESSTCVTSTLDVKTQKVSIGEYNGCYIGNDNKIYCWGSGMYGALAQGGSTSSAKTPIAITGGINDWASVSTGWRHACGIKADGHLYCWGRNWYGQVGIGTTTGSSTAGTSVGIHSPTEVTGAACSWTMIAAGSMTTCGLQKDGRLYCWGSMGSTFTEPTEMAGGHTDWIYVDARSGGGCGIRGTGSAGTLYCWGSNTNGELGDGTYTNSVTTPVLVKDVSGASSYNDWTQIGVEAHLASLCGVRSNGTAYCWGDNSNGELGYGTTGGNSNLPKQVVNTANTGTWSDWEQIEGSKNFSCGVRSNGTAYCWGQQNHGRLGNGQSTTASRNTPQLVTGGFTDWVKVDPQYEWAACGLRSNNQIWCWGDSGNMGQLGANQPNDTIYTSPQQVTMPVPLQ